ncbi:unnamed protein product [Brassica oleracea]
MRRWDVGEDQARKRAVKDTRTATAPEAIKNRRTKTSAAITRLKGKTMKNRALFKQRLSSSEDQTSQEPKKRRSEVRRHCKRPHRKHRQLPFKPLTRPSRVETELEHHHTCILKHKTRHRGRETHRNTLRLRKGEPSASRHRLKPRDTNPSRLTP